MKRSKSTGGRAERNPRALAAILVRQVIDDGRSLDDVLARGFSRLGQYKDRALVQELVYGVVRWYSRLDALAGRLLARPLRDRDRDIHCLLLTGFYQCLYLRVPPHAAVSETVQAARVLEKSWAAGLLNAVLRRVLTGVAPELGIVDRDIARRTAHPPWLVERLAAAWPAQWESLLDENNRHAPMALRVNRLRGDRQAYLRALAKAGVDAAPSALASEGVVLEAPQAVESLPGFTEGCFSVQDTAAQLLPDVLDVFNGARVLDACAAPGGKTCHLLERYPLAGELVAVEADPTRAARIEENLRRLGLRATLRVADAADTESWWDGRRFDRILLDAPCSGTGVIRRHPDIKWHRRPGDVASLEAVQRRLLEAVWPLLAAGGKLVYSTCSVLTEENEAVLDAFLAGHAEARVQPIEANWGRPLRHGRQILTGEADMDGFYYASVLKS